jgi:L-ascorbate metabolism protein UlaG (beta-lactamase superfamily)
MNVKEAAELANTIIPKTVIPIHYGLKRIDELKQFKKLLDKGIAMKTMHSENEN